MDFIWLAEEEKEKEGVGGVGDERQGWKRREARRRRCSKKPGQFIFTTSPENLEGLANWPCITTTNSQLPPVKEP